MSRRAFDAFEGRGGESASANPDGVFTPAIQERVPAAPSLPHDDRKRLGNENALDDLEALTIELDCPLRVRGSLLAFQVVVNGGES